MRKLVVLIAASLLLFTASAAWADVTVKANDDGATATVTFSTKANGVKDVTIAGTMNGWNTTANPLDKGADGLWTFVYQAKLDEVILYKFLLDGTWTPDEGAPDFDPDPYGGKNGKVDVAALLAGPATPAPATAATVATAADGTAPAAASAKPAVKKLTPLSFSTWTILRSDTKFLTKDLQTKKTNGYDLDSEIINAKSYWDIKGDILPGVNLFTELQVAQGDMKLYQSNTLGSEVPFVTPADGFQTFLEGFQHPLSTFGTPLLGHLKTRISGDWLSLFTGFNYAQNSGHNPLLYTNVKADNAGPGFLEIGMGEKLKAIIEGVKMDMVVAPNKRLGNGMYSWVNVSFGDFSVDAGYNAKSNKTDLFAFYNDWIGMASFGGSAKFGALTLKLQGLTDFGTLSNAANYSFTANSAAGLSVNVKLDKATIDATWKIAGDSATTIYGDDDTLKKGNMFAELKDTVNLDPVSLGVDLNLTTTSKLADIGTNDIKLWTKPHVYLDLASVLPFKLGLDAFGSMNFDFVDGTKFGYKLNDAGIKLNASKLGEVLTGASLMYGINFKYLGYDTAKLAYPNDMMFNTVLGTASFADNMNASFGLGFRTLQKDFGSDTAARDSAVAQQSPVGFALGWSYILPIEEIKNPTLYVNYTYNLDPYDDGQDGFKLPDNGAYRPDNLEGSAAESHVRVGLRWSF